MRYKAINPKLFIENRQRFIKSMKPNSMAIFISNDEMPRSADSTYAYRQNADTFYLSGIDQEQTVLILFPDCPLPAYREALFLRQTNATIAVWEGHKYTKEEARAATGIKNIFWNDDLGGAAFTLGGFSTMFEMLMHHAENVYLNLNEHDRFSTFVPYHDLRFANTLREKFPLHTYHRAAPTLRDLRSIKSEYEVEVMKEAARITDMAFRRTLKFIRPGVHEFEIEAEVTHEFIRNRASGHAYTPIIATGGNACVLHYIDNSAQCKDGEVILMDFGADYANYAADLSRSVPVSGKFTKRQKDVYNAVLRVMKFATSQLVVGNLIDKYHDEVGRCMEEELIKLKLLNASEVKKQDPTSPLYKKYFMHGTSHFLGIDVHDVGNKYKTMRAGTVFTCEPGIYIPEENLGVRLENDILITPKGNLDLMASIPLEAEEIESLMAARK